MTGGPQPRDGLHRSLSPPRRSNSPHGRPRYPAISDVRSRVIRTRYSDVDIEPSVDVRTAASPLGGWHRPSSARGARSGEWYRACGTRRRVFTIEQIDQLHGRLGNAETQSDYVLSLVALGVAVTTRSCPTGTPSSWRRRPSSHLGRCSRRVGRRRERRPWRISRPHEASRAGQDELLGDVEGHGRQRDREVDLGYQRNDHDVLRPLRRRSACGPDHD